MKKWFTLIEVLISIVILAMSVALILWIITNIQSLRNTAYSKTIGTMLSKEWLELFYNLRNSNIMSWGRDLDWNCISVNDSDGSCQERFLAKNTYIANILSDGWYQINKMNNLTDGDLYICDVNGTKIYTSNYNSTCIKSEFSRYIYIDDYKSSNQIFTINSVVNYKKNGFSWSVNLQSTIGNI